LIFISHKKWEYFSVFEGVISESSPCPRWREGINGNLVGVEIGGAFDWLKDGDHEEGNLIVPAHL
jgi:hypothetical protein